MGVVMRSMPNLRILVFLLALPATAAEKVPLTAERSWQIERIGPPSISPDGRWAVVAASKADVAENRQAGDLWLYATDGSVERRLTADPGDDNSPVFSPDGKSVAFVSRRGDEKAPPQIYVIGIDGGEAARVTDWPTGVGQIKWSPDGQHIYFLSRVSSRTGDRTSFTYGVHTLLEPRFRRFLRAYHAEYPLTPGEVLFLKEAYRFFLLNYVVREGRHFFRYDFWQHLLHDAVDTHLPSLDEVDLRPLLDELH